MPCLITLPDEIRLLIFEYVFCDLRIKIREQQYVTTRQHARETSESNSNLFSIAFSIFQVSKAFAEDPILHKALRTGATVHLTEFSDIDKLRQSLKVSQIRDLRHFSFLWKRRSVCPKGRVGKAIDVVVEALKSSFPGMATLNVTTNRFEICLQYPTVQDMELIGEHAKEHGTSTRYVDDCGNIREVDLIVYDEFHCCSSCIQHHVQAVRTGVDISFAFKVRHGHSFGRPGMSDEPFQAYMSTKNYVLDFRNAVSHYRIPQRTFEDLQCDPPNKERGADFFYSWDIIAGMNTRLLKLADGTILRQYAEDRIWRAG